MGEFPIFCHLHYSNAFLNYFILLKNYFPSCKLLVIFLAESDDEDYVDILTDKPVFSIRDLPVPKQIKYFEEEEKEFDREYQIKKKECERLKKLRDQATQKRKKSVADLKNNAFNNQLADASVKLFGTTEESFKACRTLATSFSELVNHLKRKGLNVESVLFPQHAGNNCFSHKS